MLAFPSEPKRLALTFFFFFTQNNLAESEVALYRMHAGKLVFLKRLWLFIYSVLIVCYQIYFDNLQKSFFQFSMTQMIGHRRMCFIHKTFIIENAILHLSQTALRVLSVQSVMSWHFPTLNSDVVLSNCKLNFSLAPLDSFNFFSSLFSRMGRLLLTQVKPGRQGQENANETSWNET